MSDQSQIEAAKDRVNSDWGYMNVIQSAVNAAVAEAVRDVIPVGWKRASPELISSVAILVEYFADPHEGFGRPREVKALAHVRAWLNGESA